VSSRAAPRLLAVNPTSMFSGAERVLVDYLVHLQTAGWLVRCACPEGPLRQELAERGLMWKLLEDVKLPAGNKVRALSQMTGAWRRAADQMQQLARDADVVLVNGLMALPALRKASVPVPVVWLVHDVIVRRDLQILVRGSAAAVDLAVPVSEAASVFPSRCGIPATVVLNGTDFPVPLATPAPKPAVPVVGVSAVLTPWKGHEIFLEAAAMVREPATFELMGGAPPKDDGYRQRLETLAAVPALRGRVGFLGHVQEPLKQLGTWTIAVSPSIDPEACPLNVLEAMSMGVPMVVTNHGGAAELIHDAGLKVAPRDPVALADAITRLLRNEEERNAASHRGPQIVKARYRREDVAARFASVMADAVANGKRVDNS